MLCHPWVVVTPEQAEALPRSSPESLYPLRQLCISRGFLKPPSVRGEFPSRAQDLPGPSTSPVRRGLEHSVSAAILHLMQP